MRTPPNLVQLLADRLVNRPQDFGGEAALDAIAWLLEYAEQVRGVEMNHHLYRARWVLLPEAVRRTACRRQVAALAARLAMRGGMESNAAISWVIAVAGMTRRDFQRACDSALRNSDRLYIWQWRELRVLELRNDFMSRRQIECWLELEEPCLFDDRWVYPLHLVDKDVLAQFNPQGGHDALE